VRVLTTDDIHHETSGIRLHLGRQPLFVPPRPAVLLTELPALACQQALVGNSPSRGWLFLGTVPG
jgi:hypothetical protein